MSDDQSIPAPQRCRSCRASIYWAVTEKGKNAPIDAEPSEAGNVQLSWNPKERKIKAVTFSAEEAKATNDTARIMNAPWPLRTNHFTTCRDRDAWRKRK